jgi:dTDP-4-dehydrorhamnose 3,5-epimerase
MEKFKFAKTNIKDLILIDPFIVEDDRGTFIKTYEQQIFKKNNILLGNAEDIMSISKKGVLRGMHFQIQHPQDKLVRVVSGEAFDVAVDLRKDSKTYGKWQGFYLSGENKKMLYIPKGFAHGFLAVSEEVVFCYRCGEKYYPELDSGIVWDDEDISIEWPLNRVNEIITSEKDKKLMNFKTFHQNYDGL